MNGLASAIHPGESPLAFLHLDKEQRVFSLNLDAIPNPQNVDDVAYSIDQLAIPPALEEYFKHIADEIKENADAIISRVQEIDWTDPKSITDGLQPILDFLKTVFEFVKEHPWILIPLIIPALQLFIGILGFGAEGVVAGSIAAALQARIGNVAKDSLFAYLQSAGAGGWAFKALERANMFITIAVLLVAVGELLVEKGIVDPDKASVAIEGAWNKVVDKFDPPPTPTPTPDVGSQASVLNLDATWVKYGVWAWVLMHVFVCAGEGGGF
ncbi:hypothetical protein BDZ91DRAFT_743265 [Kalaharituber pfeilii]|nr:hypothetical protein BDZ91DRAFT_743265 [Kalaharituber pfeilii]